MRLARGAGERITSALDGEIRVEFKAAAPGRPENSNPVSEIDREVEAFLRSTLHALHPDHSIIGEELSSEPRDHDAFTWVIDPLDGTTNFINGLPLFAVSIGVLLDGWPLVGAIWCASTHALRPGVYHARKEGDLCFDGTPTSRRGAGPWRGVASEPGHAPTYAQYWDTRVLGSATLEMAFVAVGLTRLAYIPHPRIWDAAAGLVLVNAAGCIAMTQERSRWIPLRRFSVPHDGDSTMHTLTDWSQTLLIGDHEAIELALAENAVSY